MRFVSCIGVSDMNGVGRLEGDGQCIGIDRKKLFCPPSGAADVRSISQNEEDVDLWHASFLPAGSSLCLGLRAVDTTREIHHG